MKSAQVLVIEGKDAGEVWEEMSATLGDNNNLLADEHSCVFVGDPHLESGSELASGNESGCT